MTRARETAKSGFLTEKAFPTGSHVVFRLNDQNLNTSVTIPSKFISIPQPDKAVNRGYKIQKRAEKFHFKGQRTASKDIFHQGSLWKNCRTNQSKSQKEHRRYCQNQQAGNPNFKIP